MCNFFVDTFGTPPPPPAYQKAGYATDEPLTEKNREPPKVFAPPIQNCFRRAWS